MPVVSEDTGFDDDAAYSGSFEWWLHEPSGVTLAVRLEDTGAVSGAARPIRREELRADESAMGFEWEESPELRNWVESHRGEFTAAAVPTNAGLQRPEIADDVAALTSA